MEHRGPVEQLPTRYDLFQYDGGLYWGTKGSGSMALATAIAGWYTGHVVCDAGDHVAKRGKNWYTTWFRNLIQTLSMPFPPIA